MDGIEEDTGPEPIVPGVARALSPLVRRILALNPGARTGIGTNTYLVGIDEIVVIDPGPEDASHLDSVAGCGGDRIRWVTWTQSGPDYTEGLDAMIDRTGAEVLDPADGETILGTEFRLNVHSMPGPTSNHRTFMLEEERMLICGGLMADDRAVPLLPGQSDLTDLRASLERSGKMRLRRMAPVHGYIVEEPKLAIPAELELRLTIDDAILAAINEGASTPAEITAVTHPHAADDPALLDMLIGTTEVHLDALAADKQATQKKGVWVAA